MAKYDVWIKGWWHKHAGTVEADNIKEAEEKANALDNIYSPILCHQCAKEGEIGDVDEIEVELQE